MKKWIFLILIVLITPQYVFAGCGPKRNIPIVGPTCGLQKECPSNGSINGDCCDTLYECVTNPDIVVSGCINVADKCPVSMPFKCSQKSLCCGSMQECDAKVKDIEKDRESTKAEQKIQTEQREGPLCGSDNKGVKTAFGCLMAGDPPKMISQLLGWGAIVGAGIAFLMIVFAGIQIVLAGGDPKKVQAARELITSAIAGLFLIIFSVLLLNFIGVKILGLNSFGFGTP